MRVAISTDGVSVSRHFGRCPVFTIVDIEGDKVINKWVIENPGHHPGFLPQFFRQKGIDMIVAGGIGHRALELFSELGIKTVVGVEGTVGEVINRIIDGRLESGNSLCKPGSGKGCGMEKSVCDHEPE